MSRNSIFCFLTLIIIPLILQAVEPKQASGLDDSLTYIWPLPSSFTFGNQTLTVDPALLLSVDGNGGSSSIVKQAFDRYMSIMFKHGLSKLRGFRSNYDISGLKIVVHSDSEELQLGVDESYSLFVGKSDGHSIIGEAIIKSPQPENVIYEEEYILNSRGKKIFTCRWVRKNEEPKALIFLCHGYAMECSVTMNSTAIRLANAGYAVYGIDYEGHGKSGGLHGHVSNFDNLVEDCSTYFTKICEKSENKRKKRYLMGESMGGAMAILLHWKKPEYWDGAILVAPMCKIADKLKPSPLKVAVLMQLCKIIPKWKIVPVPDIVDVAFKLPEMRKQIRANPYCYKGRLRLKTAQELMRISLDIESKLHQVSLPFIVLHGEEDRVTDKNGSKQLYNVAASPNKTLKLYPGMWHGLLYGETLENIALVFQDIVCWLNDRTGLGNRSLKTEMDEGDQ